MAAEPLWGLDALAGGAVADATAAEPPTQVVVAVALVGVQFRQASTAWASAGADGRDAAHQRLKARLSSMFAPEISSDSGSPSRSVVR